RIVREWPKAEMQVEIGRLLVLRVNEEKRASNLAGHQLCPTHCVNEELGAITLPRFVHGHRQSRKGIARDISRELFCHGRRQSFLMCHAARRQSVETSNGFRIFIVDEDESLRQFLFFM